MNWHVQYTDDAKAQLATLPWEDIGRAEETVKRIAGSSDPLRYGSPVGDFHERRRFMTPPVQVVAWVVAAIETITVVEIVFPDALSDPLTDPAPKEPPQEEAEVLDDEEPSRPTVPSWVVHPLGVFEEESKLVDV